MNGSAQFLTSTPVHCQTSLISNKNNNEHLDSHFKQILDQLEVQEHQTKQSSCCKYLTLEEVFNQYPLDKDSKLVSIYSIIQSYDSQKELLTVMDETRKQFYIHVNLSPSEPAKSLNSTRLPTRSGDIIRIDRLRLYANFTRRCNMIDDIVIFESFKKEKLKPVCVAGQPKFEDSDRRRIEDLTEFNIWYILEATVRKTKHQYFNLVDVAFQVLCTLQYENRIILACWNGRPFEEYPCMQLIKVQQIIDTLNLSTVSKSHIYTEEFIRKIYDEHKIVFVSVYGVHRVVALTLRPLDTIVIYNLLIKADKFYYAKYCYLLYDGLVYGRAIRTVEDDSELAIALRKQIEKNCLLNESFSYGNSQLEHSMSQIIEISNDNLDDNQENIQIKREKFAEKSLGKNNSRNSVSFYFSNTLDDSTLNSEINKIPCLHYRYDASEKETIRRHFYSDRDRHLFGAIRFKSFTEFSWQHDIQDKFFQIDARFHSFVFQPDKSSINIFESMATLRKYATLVHCSSKICEYRDTFEQFMTKADKWYQEVDGQLMYIKSNVDMNQNQEIISSNQVNQLNLLRCPNCDLKSCILCLDFTLILQDYDNVLILARLTGIDANLFFNCSTFDLCRGKSDLLQKIPAMFKHAYHLTNEQTECSQKITWTLIVVEGQQRDQQEFHVIDVSAMTKTVCCGIKTNC